MARHIPGRLAEDPKEETSELPKDPQSIDDIGTSAGGIRPKRQPNMTKIEQFKVARGPNQDGSWKIVQDGSMTRLQMGKVIDSRQYNIQRLRQQGVELLEAGTIDVAG